MERFRRSEMLVGKDGMEKIKNARIAVFGVGGVGSYAAMALVRAGIHNIDIIDKQYPKKFDPVSPIKVLAENNNILVIQFEKLKEKYQDSKESVSKFINYKYEKTMQQHGSSVAISTTFLLNSIGLHSPLVLTIVLDKTTKPCANGGANWQINTTAHSLQAMM